MAEKPILFNTEMVRAILEGRKTVTRRVVKPQPIFVKSVEHGPDGKSCRFACENRLGKWEYQVAPGYRPGDILWVRETFFKFPAGGYAYKADANSNSEKLRVELGYKWCPSIHMPREAARIFLRVTDVRVERLQEMRAEDSLREGVKLHLEGCLNGEAPLKPFADLWDSTIKSADRGRYGWDANPWVWVIEFEKCEKTEEI